MSTYKVTTLDCRDKSDPYHVVVEDDDNNRVADMSALSLAHAHRIAADIAVLLPKLQPGDHVVLATRALPPRAMHSAC